MALSHHQELSKNFRYRIFEFLPAILTWLTIILGLILSYYKPLWVIGFILVFDLYWFYRVCYFVLYISLSYRQYRHDVRTNWQEKLEKELPNWQNIYHIVFLPTYNESIDVLKRTFASLVDSQFPNKKFIVILGGEERGGREKFLERTKTIRQEFGDKFFRLIITVHPKDLPEEIPGKSANITYMGHELKKIIDNELKIPYENLVVSSFDIDTCTHPQYFSCLTYKYLTEPNPQRTSYQPIALYNNNMWESNPIIRIAAFGTTFWLMTELMRPERLFTFSSHSMSWQMLVDVDFWEKDIVSEDSRIFLQGFLRYDGDYRVTPMFVPVSMNTVGSDSLWQGLKSLYKQQRRWAWGAEHIPYMIWYFRQKKDKISLYKRAYYLWNSIEGMYSWATVPILLFILGRLPLWLAHGQDKATMLAQNTPFILEWLMNLAMGGMILSAILSLTLLPPRPDNFSRKNYLVMLLQWILLPISLIIFGSIPAIEAQTRLFLGGKFRLGFWVTPKDNNL